MRRADRELTDTNQLQEILSTCKTCHLAMIDDGYPYVIPLSYCYELEDHTLTLYFHCAKEGRKINILHKNNTICFEMCLEGEPIFASKTPCNSGYYYSSILGFGNVEFVENSDEKCKALSLLMRHQANQEIEFNMNQANSVCILKVVTNNFTGKKKPRPTS